MRKDPRRDEGWHGQRPASGSPASRSGNTVRNHRCRIRDAEARPVRTVRSRCGAAIVNTEGRNGRLPVVCRVPRSRRGRARAEARLRVVGPCPNALTSFLKRVFRIARDRIRVTTDGFAVNGAAVPGGERKEVDSRRLTLRPTAEGEVILTEGASSRRNEPRGQQGQPPFRRGLRASSRCRQALEWPSKRAHRRPCCHRNGEQTGFLGDR